MPYMRSNLVIFHSLLFEYSIKPVMYNYDNLLKPLT